MTSAKEVEIQGLPKNMILGENNRPAFVNTDSACLDLFFSAVPGTDVEEVQKMLESAWNENPQLALRIIFNLGNVRGGKQDRVNYYRALSWLYERYPSTFLLNLKEIPKHSCLKCLLNLLMFFTHPDSDRYGLEGSIRSLEERIQYMASLRYNGRERKEARRYRQLQLRQEFAQSLGSLEMKFSDGTSISSGVNLEQLRVLKVRKFEPNPTGDEEDADEWDWTHERAAEERRRHHLLLETDWISPAIRDKWLAFAKARDEARAASVKEQRRSNQTKVDADVRLRLQGIEARGSAVTAEATAAASHLAGACGDPGRTALLRQMYSAVSDIFAEGIAGDMAACERGVKSLSGLYAKWAPTPGGMHDKATRISDGIAERLHSKGLLELTLDEELEPAVARSLKRDRMRRVLSRLRGEAKIPEHYVGKGAWDQVDYNRMPSRCRLIFGEKVFAKHDAERYNAFLGECEAAAVRGEKGPGVPTVKSGVLLPHEVTEQSAQADSEDKVLAAELQWKGLVDGCAAAGVGQRLRIVPVCDVSGSMSGQPMEVAVALSLLLAESAPLDSPWYGHVMTFSRTPRLVKVPGIPDYRSASESGNVTVQGLAPRGIFGSGGESLARRVEFVKGIDCGMNTDVEAVFDLLLRELKKSGSTPEEVERLAIVIFSDMEFDAASGLRSRGEETASGWETAHESITAKFQAAGFGKAPLLVYWNLRPSESIPVGEEGQPGVILISGYSAGMLRSFLEGKLEDMTPGRQMRVMLNRRLYKSLQVADGDWPSGWSEADVQAAKSAIDVTE